MNGSNARQRWSGLMTACAAIGKYIKRGMEWYADRACRREQRRLLSRLDDRILKDIGVSRLDAMREANKPFWK